MPCLFYLQMQAEIFVSLEKKCYDAFNKGRREEASRLLKQVKDPRTVMSNNNFTLLHCAAYHGWLPIVTQLINEYHFDPDCKDNKGNTPLSKARTNGKQPVVDYLEKLIGTFIIYFCLYIYIVYVVLVYNTVCRLDHKFPADYLDII